MTKDRRIKTVLLLLAILAPSLPPAAMGIMVKVELPELVSQAGQIVHGTVVSNESRMDADGAIYTFTTVSVIEELTGTVPERTIVVRNMGGRVGERGLTVSDVPTFQEGEEVVLFIEATPRVAETDLVAWEQGKFTVREGVVERTRQTVEEFKDEVRALLESPEIE